MLNIKTNVIFCRDNIDILKGMNSHSVDLIYLDPPFNKKKSFHAPTGSQAAGASFKDIWGQEDIKEGYLAYIQELYPKIYKYIMGMKNINHDKSDFCYLIYMAERLVECHRVLKETGSVYYHCDSTMSHYIKLLMDCIFGTQNFRNEIVWHYGKWSNVTKNFQKNHDTIFYYSKSKEYYFNPLYLERINKKNYETNKLKDGTKQLLVYNDKGSSIEIIEKFRQMGYKIVYVAKKGVLESDVWTFLKSKKLNILHSQSKERIGYPTQKPLSLLERIVKASSNEGDVVLDPFCGCATTCVAAHKLNRQWIGIDVSRIAYHLVSERIKKEIDTELPFNPNEIIHREDIPDRTDIKTDELNYKQHKIEIRHILYEKQDGKCNGCQAHFPLKNFHIDHITSQKKGGAHNQSNLQLLCGWCNSLKGSRDMKYLLATLKEKGFIS